jgi:dTDP-4-dehydrorhamnose 3,5-epimerase-like enzyme
VASSRTNEPALFEEVAMSVDARGFVFEPLSGPELPAQRNVHVVLTEPGGIRGNHFHECGTETAVVVGPALVRTRRASVIQDIHVPSGKTYRFTFPPGVSHAFQNTGSQPLLLVSFNSEPFNASAPDVIRDVLIS